MWYESERGTLINFDDLITDNFNSIHFICVEII